jgi:hypothetical protein
MISARFAKPGSHILLAGSILHQGCYHILHIFAIDLRVELCDIVSMQASEDDESRNVGQQASRRGARASAGV